MRLSSIKSDSRYSWDIIDSVSIVKRHTSLDSKLLTLWSTIDTFKFYCLRLVCTRHILRIKDRKSLGEPPSSMKVSLSLEHKKVVDTLFDEWSYVLVLCILIVHSFNPLVCLLLVKNLDSVDVRDSSRVESVVDRGDNLVKLFICFKHIPKP